GREAAAIGMEPLRGHAHRGASLDAGIGEAMDNGGETEPAGSVEIGGLGAAACGRDEPGGAFRLRPRLGGGPLPNNEALANRLAFHRRQSQAVQLPALVDPGHGLAGEGVDEAVAETKAVFEPERRADDMEAAA